MPHGKVLLHQGSAGIVGTAMDIAIQADDLRHTRDTVLRLIAEDTGQPVDQVERDSQRDRWYTAEQAREYGFVDAWDAPVRPGAFLDLARCGRGDLSFIRVVLDRR